MEFCKRIVKLTSAVVMAILPVLLLLTGCGMGNTTTVQNKNAVLDVQGHHYKLKVSGTVQPGKILVTAGTEGFYWALPQAGGELGMGQMKEPAVICYTPFKQEDLIDPETAQVVYRLPFKDICNTGAWPGALRLLRLELHGKWLFYFYGSEMKTAAQSSYVALGVLDTFASHPESTARFLYRGSNNGGGQLKWAADENFVIWQQGYPYGGKGFEVTTELYDLETGRQQALPFTPDTSEFVLDGGALRYTDSLGAHTLQLPQPGSGKLALGAYRLPAVAYGETFKLLVHNFHGSVYLPAVVNPAPFYQVTTRADADHYQVTFNASEHPVPLNATDGERQQLGGDPSMAGILGTVEGYTNNNPSVLKWEAESLPEGQPFSIHFGSRILTGHFVNDSASAPVIVWWRDGAWSYILSDYDMIWQDSEDPGLQRALKKIIDELPLDGNLVPGCEQGEVKVSFAPDHRETDVWFHKNGEWIHLNGYKYDAIWAVQDLVVLNEKEIWYREER